MKFQLNKFFAFSFSVLSLFSIVGCKETCPGVNLIDNTVTGDTISVPVDASLSTQKRNVILEDFTGVQCVNCPDGHTIAASIINSYPAGRVVVVAMHSGHLLTNPYSFGHYDFRTTEGDDIENLVGPISSKPIGDIDRKLFAGETTIPVGRAKWVGYVAQDMLDSVPKVQMKMESQYTDATRILSLGVTLQYSTAITNNLNLSVMLTESGMIEPQLGGPNGGATGIDTFYVHRHVLRDMITPSTGMPVIGTKTPGHATKYMLPDFTIPASWNADSVKIVSLITDADSLKVWQVIDKTLK